MPVVAWSGLPAGAAQDHRRGAGGRAAADRVRRDRLGERVGRVDEGVHVLLAQPGGQPSGPPKPPVRTSPTREPGRVTRPAREVVTRTPDRAARSAARRRASVVPPRISTCRDGVRRDMASRLRSVRAAGAGDPHHRRRDHQPLEQTLIDPARSPCADERARAPRRPRARRREQRAAVDQAEAGAEGQLGDVDDQEEEGRRAQEAEFAGSSRKRRYIDITGPPALATIVVKPPRTPYKRAFTRPVREGDLVGCPPASAGPAAGATSSPRP